MSTYTASDDGKVVDGRIVVWIRPPRSSDPQEEERAATQESTAAQNPGQAKDEEKKGEEKQEPEKPEPGKLASPASQQKTSTAAQKPGQAKDKEKKGEEKQKPEKAEPGKLSNPSWHSESYEHGEKAEMLVEAPWLDGRKVRFIVERHAAGEEWEQVAEVTATVSGGRAKASVEIKGDELKNPRCVREQSGALVLVADAPGVRDGREVEFTIENEVNGQWQPQAPAKGVVKLGKAEAQVALPKGKHRFHAEVLPEMADGNLRFRAELI